jgi:hypothetical protein
MAKIYQGGNKNLYHMLAIVLSVLLWYTDSDYPLGILWPLCCLIFYDIQILIIPWYLLAIVLSVRTDNTMAKRYQGDNQNLYIIEEQTTQWPKDTKGVIRRFVLHPWYILAIVLSVLLWFTDSDYTLGIFWPLCWAKKYQGVIRICIS